MFSFICSGMSSCPITQSRTWSLAASPNCLRYSPKVGSWFWSSSNLFLAASRPSSLAARLNSLSTRSLVALSKAFTACRPASFPTFLSISLVMFLSASLAAGRQPRTTPASNRDAQTKLCLVVFMPRFISLIDLTCYGMLHEKRKRQRPHLRRRPLSRYIQHPHCWFAFYFSLEKPAMSVTETETDGERFLSELVRLKPITQSMM